MVHRGKSINMKYENLHNATDKKWDKVKKYIDGLEPHNKWGVTATKHFEDRKQEALDSLHANTALQLIGYDPKGTPDLIRETWRIHKSSQ